MTDEEIIGLAIDCDVAFANAKPQRKALLNFARVVATKEREACAMACEETGEQPSSLWEEPGCWTQAAETCAFAIRMRSNAEVSGAGTASAGLPG